MIKKSVIIFFSLSFILSCVSAKRKVEDIKPKINPATNPVIRINTNMHTASIARVSVDFSGRYIVTGSRDKTVKIFDGVKGKLLKTIRPPLDNGNEGKIYAVSISPDGSTIACSGWTCWDWDKDVSIYIYNTENGKQIKRITGHPDVIFNLIYSPDGKYLVASLGSNGIRVYNTADYTLNSRDTSYGDSTYYASFDKSGRLVTACDDGYIRLYDRSFRLQRKVLTRYSKPRPVSISPDGRLIAVGYNDDSHIDIYSGEDLAYKYSANTTGFTHGFYATCWSADGKSLYAGGQSYKKDGEIRYILRWKDSGKSSKEEIAIGNDSIQTIVAIKNDMVAFAASDPVVGVIKNNKVQFINTPSIANHMFNNKRMKISSDGSSVYFGYKYNNELPALFSFKTMVLNPSVKPGSDLNDPLINSSSMKIDFWQHYLKPTLNGTNLPIANGEVSRCAAVSYQGTTLLLGASWNLYCFNRYGSLLWSMPAPSIVWDVNISSDGRFGIASFGDGTIRWFRLSDGKELLSFFPHNDRKRWIVWTPKGYYATSPGADELIGWHINQGRDKEGLFFPAFAFSQYLNKPELIQEIIKSCQTDEEVLLRLGAKYPDIASLVPDLMDLISKTVEEKKVEGVLIGKIYNINNASFEITVASRKASDIMLGDKLFTIIDGKKIYFKANFPMMTIARCSIVDRKMIKNLALGMPVYK